MTWARAGLLLLVAVLAGILKSGSPWALELLDRTIPASLMLLLLYVTVTIILVQIGTPKYTFWQVFPSAAVLGAIVAIAFLAWVAVQERQVDLILTLGAVPVTVQFEAAMMMLIAVNVSNSLVDPLGVPGLETRRRRPVTVPLTFRPPLSGETPSSSSMEPPLSPGS